MPQCEARSKSSFMRTVRALTGGVIHITFQDPFSIFLDCGQKQLPRNKSKDKSLTVLYLFLSLTAKQIA